ncbi:glycosyltransferase family 4 protein [Agarivorans albus]
MKKILVLTPRFPYPVIGGDRLRIYQQCRELSKKYELTLLSLCEEASEMELSLPQDGVFSSVHRIYLPKYRSYLNCCLALPTKMPLQVAYYKSSKFKKMILSLVPQHDIVFSHLIRVGDYVKNIDAPKVLEMTDSISLNYERVSRVSRFGGFKNIIYSLEKNRLKQYEKNVVNSFDFSILVSDVDKDYLFPSNEELRSRVLVCSNGVDTDSLHNIYKKATNTVAFIGNLTSVQNYDAAKWFAVSVMPLLLARGDFKFRVIGRISEEKKFELECYPGVEVFGGVDSIPEAAQNCIAGVCPVRLGAGVQNKILEYMSLGLPTISSSVGLEGISAEVGKDILVADGPKDYVEYLHRLATDDDFANQLSLNGRAFVELHHDWSSKLSVMVKRFDELMLKG